MAYELETEDVNIKDYYKKGETNDLPSLKVRMVDDQGQVKYLLDFDEYDVVALLRPPIDTSKYYLYLYYNHDSDEERYFVYKVECYAIRSISDYQLQYTYELEKISNSNKWRVTINNQYTYYYKKIEIEKGNWYKIEFTQLPDYKGELSVIVSAIEFNSNQVRIEDLKTIYIHESETSIMDIEFQFPKDYNENKIYSYKYYNFWFKLKVKYGNQVWSPNSYSIQVNVTDTWGQIIDTNKYQVKITKDGDWYKVEFKKLPEIKGSIHITVNIIKDGEDLGEWPRNKETGFVEPIVLNLVDYACGVSRCYITTDREYYPYASAEPVNIRVKVFGFKDDQSDIPLDNCTIEDNWPKTDEYIQIGPGEYEAFLPINHLPPGIYHIYVKVDPGSECKSNVSENYVEYIMRYYNSNKDQTFKMPHPLFEDLHVYINDVEIPTKAYTTVLNDYGECILKIRRDQYQLKSGDAIKLKYKPYLTTVSFYVGNPFPISYEAVDDEAYKKYGIDTSVKIYVPFLQSVEEAKKIAETYLQYLSKPSTIITTNNKWDGD